MINAVLEYRTESPDYYFVIQYCNLRFTGDSLNKHTAEMLTNKWHEVEFSEFDRPKPLILKLEKEVEAIRNSQESLPWYRFVKWNKLEKKLDELTDKLSKAESSRFKSTSILISEARDFLEQHGFYQYNEALLHNELNDRKEFWRCG